MSTQQARSLGRNADDLAPPARKQSNRGKSKMKRARGRPKLHDPRDPGLLQIVRWAAQRGATYGELADLCGIARSTFNEWMLMVGEFAEAVNSGSLDAFNPRIVRALGERAAGYSYDTEKVKVQADGSIIRYTVREHMPPDTGAITLWLKNRDPANWRDQQDINFTGNTELPDNRRAAMAVLQLLQQGMLASFGEQATAPQTIEHEDDDDEDDDSGEAAFDLG